MSNELSEYQRKAFMEIKEQWCSGKGCYRDCSSDLLNDGRVQLLLTELHKQLNNCRWVCREQQDVIKSPHDFGEIAFGNTNIWLELMLYLDTDDLTLELCVDRRDGDISEQVYSHTVEHYEGVIDRREYYRVIDNIIRYTQAFIETGYDGIKQEQRPKFCLQINNMIWRYNTAEEAWNNKDLRVRRGARYDTPPEQEQQDFKDFEQRLLAGEELQYYAMCAYYEGATEVEQYVQG